MTGAPYETLEQRVDYLCAFTKGKMPVGCVVADEDEKARAVALLEGKRNGKLVSVRTREEHNRDVHAPLQERH